MRQARRSSRSMMETRRAWMAASFELCGRGHRGQYLASRFNTLHLAKPYLKELAHSILRGLLQRGASEPGEAKAAGKVLADFPHDTMEGSLADQEVRRPLVLSDFAQRDGAYAEPVRPSDWAKAANGSTAASFSAVGHSLCVRAAAARPFMRSVLRCDCDAPRQ